MMSDRTRSARLFLAAALLLFVAILALLPIAFSGDPAEGKEYIQREIILACLLLSSAFGFASATFFIRGFQAASGGHFGSRRQPALTGLLLLAGACLLGFWALSAQYDASFRVTGFFIALLVWYFGGGFLVASFKRIPGSEDGPIG